MIKLALIMPALLLTISVSAFASEKIIQPLAIAKTYCGTTFDALRGVWSGTSPTATLVTEAVHKINGSGYTFSDFATEKGKPYSEKDFRDQLTLALTNMETNKNTFKRRQDFEKSMDVQELACLVQRSMPDRSRDRK
ncbi:putative secreted protein [Enterobacter sp. J49]|uniref:hypothetical protein n=1 Tax=Enterobacter sp. J49 TaxID=1903627 RepID=UPI000A3BA8AC|nr:hypothetical protein [Enterobacter sp. J49]OUC37065.1 putative secreted protein [Enterobacter sp. J49]